MPGVMDSCVSSKHSGFQKRSVSSTPGAIPSVSCAITLVEARRDVTFTQSPSSMPYSAAVCGLMRRSGAGISSRMKGAWRMVP